MNTRELIEKIKKIAIDTPFQNSKIVDHLEVIKLIEQLDEPEKIVVSEEEAKFLKTFDFNYESDVTKALYHVSRTGWGHYLTDNDGIELKDFSERFMELENRKRLIKAILDGYEVEREPKYTIKFKATKQYLCDDEIGPHFSPSFRSNFRKSDLEKLGLAEIFNSPLFEVEEV